MTIRELKDKLDDLIKEHDGKVDACVYLDIGNQSYDVEGLTIVYYDNQVIGLTFNARE